MEDTSSFRSMYAFEFGSHSFQMEFWRGWINIAKQVLRFQAQVAYMWERLYSKPYVGNIHKGVLSP